MPSTTTLINDELWARIHDRAAAIDAQNGFFFDDLEDLREAGYLGSLVPTELGGLGRSLPDVIEDQVRLATAAPATAIAINMHVVWLGMGWFLHRLGDASLDGMLREAASGEVFAFGYSEAGNNATPRIAKTLAEPLPDGGYRFTGTKIFTSLSPAWTRLGVMGVDASGDEPTIVHAFLERGQDGIDIAEDWDTVGMRATQSRTTRLDGAVAPAGRVFRRVPVGGADALVLANALMFNLTVSSVYVGLSRRALQLAVEHARKEAGRQSITPAAYTLDANRREHLAQAFIELDSMQSHMRYLAEQIERRTQPGATPPGADLRNTVLTFKQRVTEGTQSVVSHALKVVGGSSYRSSHELGRLYRDALAIVFHPAGEEVIYDALSGFLLNPDVPSDVAVAG